MFNFFFVSDRNSAYSDRKEGRPKSPHLVLAQWKREGWSAGLSCLDTNQPDVGAELRDV